MRIPSGDLVPARRRRYDGGYGRRRRHRRLVRRGRIALVVAVLLGLGLGAFWLTREEARPAAASCVEPSPASSPAALPAPAQVRVVLLNGTPRPRLAELVGQQLRSRGFVVVRAGNAPAALVGGSVLTYSSGQRDAARVLGRHVPGSRLAGAGPVPAGAVQLVLGGDYRRLASPPELLAAARADTPSPAPGVRVCP